MKHWVTRRAKIALLLAAIFHTFLVLDRLPAWLTVVCLPLFVLEFFVPHWTRRWIRGELRAALLISGGLAITLPSLGRFGMEPVLSGIVFTMCIGVLGNTAIWWGKLSIFVSSALMACVALITDESWLPAAIVGNVLLQTILFFELNAPERSSVSLSRYLRGALLLTIPTGLIVMGISTFLPRFYRNWLPRTQVAVMGYGSAGQLAPGDVTRLVTSHRKAFRVQFLDGKTPNPEDLYWRGEVFEIADGMKWRKGREKILKEAPVFRKKTQSILHDIYLEPRFETALFTLDAPLHLILEGNSDLKVAQTTSRIFELGGSTRRLLQYHVLSAASVQEGQLSFEKRKNLTTIDPAIRTPRIALLLNQLAMNSRDPEGAILKLQRFFTEGNFKYTLTPRQFKEKSLDDFLLDSRAGFCEHYSASSASLLRLAGIPARVVTGFQGGELNRFDSLITVRDSNAHAWAEYWSDTSLAWIRFDPIKSISPERLLQGPQAVAELAGSFFDKGIFAQTSEILDAFSVRWQGWMAISGSTWPKKDWNRLFQGWSEDALFGFEISCVVIFSALFFYKVMVTLRKRQISEKDVVEIFERFCETCGAAQLVREAAEGPISFLKRCEKKFSSQSSAVPDFVHHYVHLRYSTEVVTAKDLKELAAYLKQAEEVIKRKGRRWE